MNNSFNTADSPANIVILNNPTTIQAFTNTTVTKQQLLTSLKQHREADRLIKATYWDEIEGKGCAVGCSLHDFAEGQEYEHSLYPSLFGIPEQLAFIEDAIYEDLPTTQAVLWPERFINAITIGQELSTIHIHFALWILQNPDSPLSPYKDEYRFMTQADNIKKALTNPDIPIISTNHDYISDIGLAHQAVLSIATCHQIPQYQDCCLTIITAVRRIVRNLYLPKEQIERNWASLANGLDKPYFVQLVFGQQSGIPTSPDSVLYMVGNLPEESLFQTCALGLEEIQVNVLALLLGGHVRTGMEDCIDYQRDEPARGNAQLVERIVRIANDLGRRVATVEETRQMLGID